MRARQLDRLVPPIAGAVLLVAAAAPAVMGFVHASRDLYAHDIPETHFLVTRWKELSIPWWLPHARMGQPFAALLYTQVFYVPRVVIGMLVGPVAAPTMLHLFHCLFGFIGTFLAARKLGLMRMPATIAAIGTSFSPFFAASVENLSFASTAAWAGWLVWGALHVRERPEPASAALLAFLSGGALHAGAPDMWAWETALVFVVVLARGFTVRRLLLTLGATVCALGLGAVVLLPALELTRVYGTQTNGGQLEWSASLQQLLSIFIPSADQPRVGEYWGSADQRFYSTLFIGSTVAVLLLGALFARRARAWFAFVLVLLLLALGKNSSVASAVLSLPGLNVFRYPVKYVAGATFGLCMLAAFGLQRWLVIQRRLPQLNDVFRVFAIGAAFGLAVVPLVMQVREGFRVGALWTSGVLSLVALAASWRHRWWPLLCVMLLGAEAMVGSFDASAWYHHADLEMRSPIAPKLRDAYRVSIRVDMNDTDVPWCAARDDEDDTGMAIVADSRARLSALRFIEEDVRATGGYGFRDPPWLQHVFEQGATAYALAGVSAFVRNSWEAPPFTGLRPERTLFDDVWVWRGAPAFPRSWIVHRSMRLDEEQTLAALRSSPLDRFREEVIVTEEMPPGTEPVDGCEEQLAHTIEERPERVHQVVKLCSDGYVVLGDAFFPGWKAKVDGSLTPVVRANGFERVIFVKAGTHMVDWVYSPRSATWGGWISVVALILMVGASGIWRRRLSS